MGSGRSLQLHADCDSVLEPGTKVGRSSSNSSYYMNGSNSSYSTDSSNSSSSINSSNSSYSINSSNSRLGRRRCRCMYRYL